MTEGEEKNKELVKVAEESSLCEDGGPSDQESVKPRFECPICISWLREPILTSCGHRFCSDCIHMWLKKRASNCPVDGTPLNPEIDLFQDLFTKREIAQQKTHCLYRGYGCKMKLSPIDLDDHMNECPFKNDAGENQLNCLFKDIGCRQILKNIESLNHHLEENIPSHLRIIASTLSHLVSKCNMDAKAAEAKFWDAPYKRETDAQQESQSLIHELWEKVVVLEQENRHLKLSLENLESTFLERNCNGSWIWRLESFKEKLDAMIDNRLNMFFSPSFYTKVKGYKVCARMNVSHNNSDYISLVLHFVKSENDDALNWPFEGWIAFILVHPDNSSKNIHEIAVTHPNLDAFKKPIYNINRKSYGYTEFISIKDLQQFIKNDTLIIRIEVKSIEILDSKIEDNIKIHTEV